ncbi:hypothetical protein HNY73_022051 [Argiope bruennichi]|uniref:Uncharacterized protein n=1 Tax=Argiope bruennichi TaxID=94029 RepID=A0A8T0E1Z5_ARGBR|nr:hypothetical protein HNY73_022051 [Argiope bruennichi]
MAGSSNRAAHGYSLKSARGEGGVLRRETENKKVRKWAEMGRAQKAENCEEGGRRERRCWIGYCQRKGVKPEGAGTRIVGGAGGGGIGKWGLLRQGKGGTGLGKEARAVRKRQQGGGTKRPERRGRPRRARQERSKGQATLRRGPEPGSGRAEEEQASGDGTWMNGVPDEDRN